MTAFGISTRSSGRSAIQEPPSPKRSIRYMWLAATMVKEFGSVDNVAVVVAVGSNKENESCLNLPEQGLSHQARGDGAAEAA